MTRVHLGLLFAGLLVSGCEEPAKGETALAYRITPDSMDLGSVRYDQDELPTATISVLNLDARTLRVTPLELSGTGAAMVELEGENYEEIAQDETADITLTVVDDTLLWDPGSLSLSLTLTIGTDEGDTGTETAWLEESVVVSVSLAVDCDLDDDGAEASATGGADCDDTLAAVSPSATELCNEVDDDCDGFEDEDDAADALIWYRDGDEDDYGSAESTTTACEEPDGFVANGADCDDGNAEIYPSAEESCNGLDDDCDTLTDEEPECAPVDA